MNPENLEQLNEIFIKPLRQALIDNEHVEVFKNHYDWGVQAAASTLRNPNLMDEGILDALDLNLYKILNQGQAPCNSNFLGLSYGYTYLYQRINAIEKSFITLQYLPQEVKNKCLFVDIGCGIGGLHIALRNLHENEDFILNYRGYDIVQEVLILNESVLNQIYPNNTVTINDECIESFGNTVRTEIDSVIMVFSYLFSQNGIDEDALTTFKEKVDSLFNEFNLEQFFIVYINIGPSYYNENYKKFINLLETGGYIVKFKRERSQELINERLTKLSNLAQNLEVLPDSNVHCTVMEIKRV